MSLINTLQNIQWDKNRNLTPENLKKGTTCLGVTGTADLLSITADADAVAGDILKGKTAYVNSIKLTGTYEPESTGSGSSEGFVAPSSISFAGMTESEFDFSGLDTKYVTKMNNMFGRSYNLTSIDITSWDTSNVTTMADMFYQCNNAKSINVSNLDTRNVTNMYSMFSYTNMCTDINLTGFNTSSVTDMERMFCRTNALNNLDLSSFDTSKVTRMTMMFSSYVGPKADLNLSSFNVSNVTYMNLMFYQAARVVNIDFTGWDTSNVIGMSQMFTQLNVTDLNIGHFNTAKVNNMYQTFQGITPLKTLNIADWNTSNLINIQQTFTYLNNMISLFLNNWDTSKLTMGYQAFYFNPNLVTLNISNWNFVNVTNMYYMFASCNNLSDESLDGILGVLSTVNKLSTSNRTLKYVGLTSDQATLCTTLPNWTNCTSIGWTTGY